MNTESFINKIYDNMISVVLKNIEAEYVDVISKAYYDRLLRIFSGFSIDSSHFDSGLENAIKLEMISWENVDSNMKKHLLLKDVIYEQIEQISLEGLKCAEQRFKNQHVIEKEYCNKQIQVMNELTSKLLEFNKEIAKRIIADGTIDYLYASCQSDKMSGRLGRDVIDGCVLSE